MNSCVCGMYWTEDWAEQCVTLSTAVQSQQNWVGAAAHYVDCTTTELQVHTHTAPHSEDILVAVYMHGH